MNKTALLTSIKKVYLDLKGVDEYFIFWELEKNLLQLTAVVTAFKTTTLSKIKLTDVAISNSEFILHNPDSLMKILDICGDDIDVEYVSKGDMYLRIKDKDYDSKIVLCDPDAIKQKKAEVEEPLSYDFTLPIDKAMIEKFTKAKKANGSEYLSFEIKNRKAKFEYGDSNNHSNKINFCIEQEGIFDTDEKLYFSSDMLQAVLERNKTSLGQLQISNEGLMKVVFEDKLEENTQEVTYFLVPLDLI